LRSITLGIDSSDEFLSVGLANLDGIIVSHSSEPGSQNKNVLHQYLRNVLDEANVNIGEIGAIGVAIGPGSFTGLRVGLAVAKGICWSLGLPLAGISSLLAIANAARLGSDRILVVKDARRNEFYYAAYERTNESIKQIVPDSVGPAEELFTLSSRGYRAIGPGVKELGKYSHGNLELDEGYDRDMVGGAVALLAKEKIIKGDTLDISKAAPVYIRTPRPMERKP
jgi:tRNA threonylcarbamoyladenosine biosynthesis protein TsaB